MEDYQQQERRSRIRYGVTGTLPGNSIRSRIRYGVTGTMVSPELNSEPGVTGTGTSSLRALRPESGQIWQPFPARDHQTMPEEPARDATIDSKLQTSFDIGYRLRWRNPLGGREPASSQCSWPVLLHGGRLPGTGVVRLRHFNPNRWQNLEESWKITGISRFFALAAFLLDTVSRHGQDVGVRTAYWSQEVNDGRQDSGELRKAVESTLKLQQEMLRNWTMQLSPFGTQVFELPMTGTSTSASATPAASQARRPQPRQPRRRQRHGWSS